MPLQQGSWRLETADTSFCMDSAITLGMAQRLSCFSHVEVRYTVVDLDLLPQWIIPLQEELDPRLYLFVVEGSRDI